MRSSAEADEPYGKKTWKTSVPAYTWKDYTSKNAKPEIGERKWLEMVNDKLIEIYSDEGLKEHELFIINLPSPAIYGDFGSSVIQIDSKEFDNENE